MSDAPGASPSTDTPAVRDLRRLHLWEIQAVRDVLLVAIVIFTVWLGYAMRAVTVPLLLALMLAYLFEPLIAIATTRWKLPRPVVVTSLVSTIAVVLVLSVAIAVPIVVGQSIQVVNDLRSGRVMRAFVALRENVPESLRASYDNTMESISQFLGLRYLPPKNASTTMPSTAPDDNADDTVSEVETAPDQSIDSVADDAATQPQTQPSEAAPSDSAAAGEDDTDEIVDETIVFETPPLTEEDIRDIVRIEVADQLAAHQTLAGPGEPVSSTAARVAPGLSSILNISRAGALAILGFLGNVLKIVFLFFLVPFYLFFFSMYYPQIQTFGLSVIPHRNRQTMLPLLAKMDAAVAGFVRGRIVICFIIGVICAVGWAICGVPYAILLGLITGIFSAVPYLGGLGLPIAVILLWIDQLAEPAGMRMSTLWIIGGPTLVYVIMQVLETYIITPIIAGKATNLDPVTILVAVLAGGSVGGVYGMLLSIPVAACLKIVLTDVVMPRVRDWVKGRSEDPLPL